MGDNLIKSHEPRPMNYPADSMLFDVRYYRQSQDCKECFEVITWNPITRTLEVTYEEPIIDIWILKEEYRTNKYQIAQVDMDHCYPFYCKPSQVARVIAQEIGGEWDQWYQQNKDQLNRNDVTRHMCECPWVFAADFEPPVYFRLRWFEQYGKTIDLTKVTECFLDIETDVIDRVIDLKNINESPNPVNAVTLILPHVQIAALLVLGPRPKHKIDQKFWPLLERQQKEYDWLINNLDEFKRILREEDPENKKYLEGFDIRVHIFEFDDEIKLLKTVFDYINKYRPMFVESWNAKFDHPRLWHRIEYLGYDPIDIIIPKEFKTSRLFYQEDTSGNFQMKNARDWFHTSTYSVYLCQMRLFAAIRKSQQERRSYSLESVGSDMCNIHKLTETKSGSFRMFAYTDFLKFLIYNFRDVVAQYAIGKTTNDCRTLVSRSFSFATAYPKCFQETHIVRNAREYYYRKFSKKVQACRLIVDPSRDPSFKGAFVAPPEKNAPTGLVLNGKQHNNIIFGALDADAASYYPSTKMGMNMDPMSLLYKCIINNDNFQNGNCINRSLCQEYLWYDTKNKPHVEDMTGPIINAYKNKNVCSLMNNWFALPTISQYFEYLDTVDTK